MLASVTRNVFGVLPSLVQLAGGGCLAAAAFLAWGLAACLASAGGLLIVFGVAAEMRDA